jgi:Protein of unknown function (DUF1059)
VDRVLRCECGFEARGVNEEELVAEVRRHAHEAHEMSLSHDEALLVASRAERDRPPATPSETTTRTGQEER